MMQDAVAIDPSLVRAFEERIMDPWWRLTSGALYKILTKDNPNDPGTVIPFTPNEAQLEYFGGMWYRNVIPKARQRGITTAACIYLLDHALFVADQRCGLIAHTKPDAEAIFRDKVKFAYENLPAELRALMPLRRDASEELLFAHNNSSVRVSTSMRSQTIHRLHVCLSGDVEVRLKDGVVKPIRDVREGDLVMSDRGSYQRVARLVQNRIEDVGHPLLAIETFGHYAPLKITGNHEILTREFKTGRPVWRRADEVRPGDYIAQPVKHYSARLRDGCLPFGPAVQQRDESGRRVKDAGRRIPANRDLGYLVGLYLAEGSARRTEVAFSIHRDETADVVARLRAFETYFTSARVYDSANSLTTMVTVNGRDFADFLTRFFGAGPDKRIPDAVWNYGRPFLDGLVLGYFAGDGCFTNRDVVQVTSIRRQLIDQMRALLISMRFGVPTVYHRPAGRYYGRDCKESWVLKLYGPANWKFRKHFGLEMPNPPETRIGQIALAMGRNPDGRKFWRRGKAHYWTRITDVRLIPDEPFVYDIALADEPHNYVTVNGVVHNSEFGKIAAKFPERATEIISGALPAVPLTGRATIESTAEGASGRFHDICQTAKATEEQGGPASERDWKLFFFAWWTGRENRMDPAGVVISPKDHEYFDKVEGEEGCKLDLAQRAWYVATRDKQFNGDQALMWREEPSTFAECFQQSSEGAYFANELARARAGGRIVPSLPVVSTVPCHTFWDIGNSDGTAVWVMQRVAPEYRFIRFVEGWGEGYDFFVQRLQSMGLVWGTHYLPHDANHERQGAHRPWKPIEVLRDLAPTWRFEIVPPVNELIQGIQAVRQVFPECWFDETQCKEGLAHLAGYVKRWNTAAGHWMDEPVKNEHTEAADAFRQFAQAFKTLSFGQRQTRPTRRGSEHML